MYGSTEIHTKDANQSRRLLAVSSVMTGKVIRKDIALEAGVGLQTLLHDEEGPSGHRNRPVQGRLPFLDWGQLSTLKGWLETGPPEGWAGWTLSREGIRRLTRRTGFRRLSPRPIHPRTDRRIFATVSGRWPHPIFQPEPILPGLISVFGTRHASVKRTC